MIDPVWLRENPERVREAQRARGADLASELDELAALEAARRELLPRIETLKREQNAAAEEVGRAKRQGLDTSAIQETSRQRAQTVKELDAGAAFKAVKRVIGPDDTSVEVERDLAEMGADVLVEVLDEMAAGKAKETPQDESLVTYAAKITKAISPRKCVSGIGCLPDLQSARRPGFVQAPMASQTCA